MFTGRANDDLNEGFARYLRTVLENLKANMHTGIEELKIPPLDPFKLKDHIDIPIKNAGKVEIDNLQVSGLKTLQLNDIKADLIGPSASLDIHIGRLHAEGVYNADLLISRIFPIKGNGKLLIELDDLHLKGKVILETANFIRFKCTDVELSLKVGGSTFNFENIVDPKLAPTINKILSGFLPIIANNILPKVQNRITPQIVKAINKDLTKFDIGELIQKFGK